MSNAPIIKFRGDNYFLSNFYPCKIKIDSFTYDYAENAFQSFKNQSESYKYNLQRVLPKVAKHKGRHIKLINNWEDIKDYVMYYVVYQKFLQNPELAKKLLATSGKKLIECNEWHDCYWGVCTCHKCHDKIKYNKLGIILEFVRMQLQSGGICYEIQR